MLAKRRTPKLRTSARDQDKARTKVGCRALSSSRWWTPSGEARPILSGMRRLTQKQNHTVLRPKAWSKAAGTLPTPCQEMSAGTPFPHASISFDLRGIVLWGKGVAYLERSPEGRERLPAGPEPVHSSRTASQPPRCSRHPRRRK
eukprot:scaffold1459_cov260-Pinguiococcus_pyrenoidosus.AAC.2